MSVAYLDTHVVLWLFARAGEGCSAAARKTVDESETLRISPMVALELDLLHEIGRTRMGAAPICDYLSDRIQLAFCDRPFQEVVREASGMAWTRDPFDRLITAQASLSAAPLVTKDSGIRAHYPMAVW